MRKDFGCRIRLHDVEASKGILLVIAPDYITHMPMGRRLLDLASNYITHRSLGTRLLAVASNCDIYRPLGGRLLAIVTYHTLVLCLTVLCYSAARVPTAPRDLEFF